MTTHALAWVLSSGIALTTHGYVRIAQDRGVTVYQREGSRNIDLAAEGDIDAPPEKVRAVLLDYDNHQRWVHKLKETHVLKRGEHQLVVYQRLGLPIIDDRDFTLKVDWGQDGKVLWIGFVTANELGPPPGKGVVRVGTHIGGWRLEPIDGGRATHARYFLNLDLGGSLPHWMGRGRAGRDIPGLFESLRRMATQ